MRKRILSLVLVLAMIPTTLTGCGDKNTIEELSNVESLSGVTSSTKNYSMSYTEEQSKIYTQVSNRTLLDMSTLDACTDNEVQQVVNYMNSVDSQLTGQMPTDGAVIDDCFVNYLLDEFEKTPYYWQRHKMVIRGIEAESRSIVVDVTYKTIGFEKTIEPDTVIPRGVENYDTIVKNRYALWNQYLNARYMANNTNIWPTYYEQFTNYYGDPNVIIDAQNDQELSEYIYEKGNQKSYTCAVDTDPERAGATMTVRYVLVPNYVLGLNLGMSCKHMYVLSYALNEDFTKDKELFTETGYATVADKVYNLIYAYFTCIDENDFAGLNKLTTNFGKWDKYYEDLFNTTYTKHDGFSVSLFDIQGTHITCGINISSKVRAKGSNITFPIYTDKYYCEIDLEEESLKISNMQLISRTLEGEPAINLKEADVTGFSATIDLDNSDKADIEKLISNFSILQMRNDTTSDDFANTVDLTLTNNALSILKENMTTILDNSENPMSTKAVWLEQYQQGTSNYANVKCKELFQDEINSITEVDSTYEFIRKGGRWYVYGYTVNSQVKLTSTNLPTTNSLCVIQNGEELSFSSKLKDTSGTELDNINTVAVTFDYDEYTPNTNGAEQQQGKVLITKDTVTEDVFNKMAEYNAFGFTYKEFNDILNQLDDETLKAEYEDLFFRTVAVTFNCYDNRYPEDNVVIKNNAILNIQDEVTQVMGLLTQQGYDATSPIIKSLQNMSLYIGQQTS